MTDFKGLAEKLLSHSELVTETGCRIWLLALNHDGYGRLVYDKEYWQAHRAAYFCFVGIVPASISILHICDVYCCINYLHLYPGTQVDNMKDMAQRKRGNHKTGDLSRHHKLCEAQVVEIKQRLKLGENPHDIACDYDVHGQTIVDIRRGRTWGWLVDEEL